MLKQESTLDTREPVLKPFSGACELVRRVDYGYMSSGSLLKKATPLCD
jgi:hypothetical protein